LAKATAPGQNQALVSASEESLRGELLDLLRELSFRRERVVLASGRESDFFIDCKQTVLTAEGHAYAGELLLRAIGRLKIRPLAVSGVELGGCPLASAVSMASYLNGAPLDAIYVRKDAKTHGSKRLLEGGTRLAKGSPVALLEDVVTTGGSTLAADAKLREAGYSVAGVIALVDRLEGGRQAIEARGLFLDSIFTRKDFMGS
jgi:orotate phosphoribosyltransferase